MRLLRSLILLAVLVPPGVAVLAEEPSPASDLRERRHALINLVSEYWDYEDYNPNRSQAEIAAKRGERPDLLRVVDLDKAAAARLVKARGFLPRFEAIDTAGFPEHEVLNKVLLVRELKLAIEGERFRPWRMPVDQLGGIHLSAPRVAEPPSRSFLENFDLLLGNYRKIPALFDQTVIQMKKGMAKGLMPPRYLLEKVARQAEEIARMSPETSPFGAPLARIPADLPAAKRKKLRADLLAAIRKGILPAYARFAKFVRQEYAPKGRAEPGIWSLPDGDAWYAYLVRVSTTTDLSPEEIHQIGLSEVARIEGEMKVLAVRLGYPDPRSLNAAIAADPKFHAGSPEQLLALYRTHIESMQARLPELFLKIPQRRLEVVRVESYREKEFPRAEYQSGDPGRVMVNTSEPRDILEVESTAYHEGVPGHHLQQAFEGANPNLVPFRHALGYPAYVEGWALYAERLAKEIGFYQDPYDEYGRLQGEMFRAARLVVDTGLHAKRWSREQAVRYFQDHLAMGETEIGNEVDRYSVWPAQALGYKIGEMKILELRERARKELGAAFDLRKFHQQVLGQGVLPLDVLAEKIDRWIAVEKRDGA
jgi:uncharacterized protein (DUF885 family)